MTSLLSNARSRLPGGSRFRRQSVDAAQAHLSVHESLLDPPLGEHLIYRHFTDGTQPALGFLESD